MADVLTQIQDELDNFLLQMSSALETIKVRAPPMAPPGQPLQLTFEQQAVQATQTQQAQANATSGPTQTQQNQNAPPGSEPPAPAEVKIATEEELAADIKQLSYDLIMKEQQIEVLIKNLPGIGTSEREQTERMAELARQIEEVEEERGRAVAEKEELIRRVEAAIRGVGAM